MECVAEDVSISYYVSLEMRLPQYVSLKIWNVHRDKRNRTHVSTDDQAYDIRGGGELFPEKV